MHPTLTRPIRSNTARPERGTSTLEVAGMAPLVVLVIFIFLNAAITLYAITTAQTAARQGARAWSQGGDPAAVVRQSVPAWIDVDVELYGSPGHGVRATLDVPDLVPIYDIQITRETIMP